MTQADALIDRFESNLALIRRTFADIPEARMREKRLGGKWSAHANLAHLGQFHDVIQSRFEAMLREDNPTFPRFSPEADPRTKLWLDKPTPQMLADFAARRRELAAWLRALTPEQWERIGTSGAFGSMTMREWLEFYLQHEGHHVYTALVRART